MSDIFENIQFNSDIPIKIFVHNLNYTQNHWHDALEILFILEGEIHIGIGNCVYQLKKEDLIVINPNEIHTTSAQHANLVLALQISSDWLNKYSAFQGIPLSCNSCADEKKLHMNQIRKLLAQMMWVYNNQSACFEIKLQSYLFELLYQLFVYFKADTLQHNIKENEKYMPRLSNIIHFLHENYEKDITLQDLADKEYLSVSYVSRFFKKYIGTSYQEYMKRLRLEHAVTDLLFTDKSISQLSFDNGFPNTNSFLYAFKETYNETPSIYRKKIKADFNFLYGPSSKSNNYFEIVHIDMFASLYKYLTWNKNDDISDSTLPSTTLIFDPVDLNSNNTKIKHTWKNLMTIGKAKDVLNPVIQEQLILVQKDIGFRYIRFHGIFDDEMMVYSEDTDGNPVLNFTYVDRVIDFLYSIELKPFIELGFMPELLAKDKHTVFQYRKSIISMPKQITKWCYLVEQFILHCMERYGMEQIEEWFFEFWNEPDMMNMFWYDSLEDYFSFYHNTYQTVKSISKKIQIGGPAVCNCSHLEEWLNRYFNFCSSNHCLPDFFTFHCYLHNTDFGSSIHKNLKPGLSRITLSNDANYLMKTIKHIRELASSYQYHSDNIHMTEWNSSPSHRDLSRDTLFMAAYLVKNILENMESLRSFGYWTITDYIEEFSLPKECFHGGLGVITVNNIKKASYHAFSFLNKLGNNKISSGPGYYITSNTRGYQLLLYNYCHFDPLYCSMDHSGISSTDRYGIFQNTENKTMQLTLTGLKYSKYKIIERTVNRSFGSAFDAWVDMGAPENLTKENVEYLKSKSIPHYHEMVEVIKDSYTLQRSLSPHEIKLIEIVEVM